MKSKWINHLGVEYMYADYSNFHRDKAGLADEIDSVVRLVLQRPAASVLELVDLQETVVSSEVAGMLNRAAVEVKARVKKTAVVVANKGLLSVIATAISRATGMKIELFEDAEKARSWLLE